MYIYYDIICVILHMKYKCHDIKHVIGKLINDRTSCDMNLSN